MTDPNTISGARRVLILGGTGMLGHKVWQVLRSKMETWLTIRNDFEPYASLCLFDPKRTITRVDAADFGTIERALVSVMPTTVVNCLGVVKQRPTAHDPITSITVNSLFPHRLASACNDISARMIHVSTDCVFSGRVGKYAETDLADPVDLYGRSKLLGESSASNVLTLRTSIIGREIAASQGLIEWFLSHRGGRVVGYTEAIFSGLTTTALAEVVAQIITSQPQLSGLWHVGSEEISKYELLCLLNAAFACDILIQPVADVRINRSLISEPFWALTGIRQPKWQAMIRDLALDTTPYNDWRKIRVA